MKTKNAEPVLTAFPTCGEVFHFLINALELTTWADAFHAEVTKRREQSERKAVSDQLRDWATEEEFRPPSRKELEEFICRHLEGVPREEDLGSIFCHVWGDVLERHAQVVRENATWLDRKGTRAWYARMQAPATLYCLWAFQKLLRRLVQSKGPMLDAPLRGLLERAWPTLEAHGKPKHPLQLTCYKYYAEFRSESTCLIDPKTIKAWELGEDRPSCGALGRHFSQFDDKLGLLLNFAFAGLLESLAVELRAWILPADWADCRGLLLDQARCLECLDDIVVKVTTSMPALSLGDFELLLSETLEKYVTLLSELRERGVDARDMRVAKFRVYEEYQRRIANPTIPVRFGEFCGRLEELWEGTALQHPKLSPSAVKADLGRLRAESPEWCEVFAGPLLAIEARLVLCFDPITRTGLLKALNGYREAFEKSRYQAGVYTRRIIREALGLAAMLHRRESGEGVIKPWIKKVLEWWDLLGLGPDLDHERLEQRIELAESEFTDRLDAQVRSRLKSALPQLGLNHWHIGGAFGYSDEGFVERLQKTPVDKRQKKPMGQTIVGRDQTALMEAIDREQLELASELVRKGADLNFLNSTGDTCLTKAFARKYYELVLEILRRDHEPIRRETLLRVTKKMRISGLEQAISHGQVEILREMTTWKNGRGDVLDLNKARIWEQTPLYYAVNCLHLFRATPQEAARLILTQIPLPMMEELGPGALEAMHRHFAKEHNVHGILRCIEYLINGVRVDLDAPNVNDNSALTLAAESGLHDVAAMLLAAGANVNHRFRGGGTALVRAIINDDLKMAELLLEYRADYLLFVDALGLPIYAMAMSDQMRQFIPNRVS